MKSLWRWLFGEPVTGTFDRNDRMWHWSDGTRTYSATGHPAVEATLAEAHYRRVMRERQREQLKCDVRDAVHEALREK